MKKALASATNADKGRGGIWICRPVFPPHDIKNTWRFQAMTKKEFLIKAINELMEDCNEVSLLEMIYKVLCKSMSGRAA